MKPGRVIGPDSSMTDSRNFNAALLTAAEALQVITSHDDVAKVT